jgi:hypothetical protein
MALTVSNGAIKAMWLGIGMPYQPVTWCIGMPRGNELDACEPQRPRLCDNLGVAQVAVAHLPRQRRTRAAPCCCAAAHPVKSSICVSQALTMQEGAECSTRVT